MSSKDFEEETSEELVRHMQEGGEEEDWQDRGTVLTERLDDWLLHSARCLTGDPDRAEELKSRVWEVFYDKLGKYDPGRAMVKTWLHGIVFKEWLAWARREGRRTRCLALMRLCMSEYVSGSGMGSVRKLVGQHCDCFVLDLPFFLRRPFRLHYIDGLSFHEVGRVMHVSSRSAQYRANTALEKLRSHAPELVGLLRFVGASE